MSLKLNPELSRIIAERRKKYEIFDKTEFDIIRLGNHSFADYDVKDYIDNAHYSNRETYYRFTDRPNKSELDFLQSELIDLEDISDKLIDYENIILWNLENFYPDEFDDEFRYWYKIKIQARKNIDFVKSKIIQETFFSGNDRGGNDINKSNFPEIFKSEKAEKLFFEYVGSYILDAYTDYSYIYQQMKNDKLIERLTHFEFADWLLSKELISENDHSKIKDSRGFKSLRKSSSDARLNNYINLKTKTI